jgi:hypothetical protein
MEILLLLPHKITNEPFSPEQTRDQCYKNASANWLIYINTGVVKVFNNSKMENEIGYATMYIQGRLHTGRVF